MDAKIIEILDQTSAQVIRVFEAYEAQIIKNRQVIRGLAAQLQKLDEDKKYYQDTFIEATNMELGRRLEKDHCIKLGFARAAEHKDLLARIGAMTKREAECRAGAIIAIEAAKAEVAAKIGEPADQKYVDALDECQRTVPIWRASLPVLEGVYESFRLAEQRDRERKTNGKSHKALHRILALKTYPDQCANFTLEQLQDALREIAKVNDEKDGLPPLKSVIDWLNQGLEGKVLIDDSGSVVYDPAVEDPKLRITPLCGFLSQLVTNARSTYATRIAAAAT
jgi:hypothetical protein